MKRPRRKSKRRRQLALELVSATHSDNDTCIIPFGSHYTSNEQDHSVSFLDASHSQNDILSNNISGASVSTKSLNHSDNYNIRCFQNHSEVVHDVPQGSPLQDKMDEFEFPSSSFSSINRDEKVATLMSMFPSMTAGKIKFLLDIAKGDSNVVCDVLLEGITSGNLIGLLKETDGEVKRIRVATYRNEDTLDELLALYKMDNFNPSAILRISVTDQPAIDTGGVRRQFFSDALFKLSNSENLFERTEKGVLPLFRQSTLSSGLFTAIGKLIGHSIVMDRQGFSHLSPAIYYYMAGHTNTAVSAVSMGDLGCYTKHIITKVKCYMCKNVYNYYIHSSIP